MEYRKAKNAVIASLNKKSQTFPEDEGRSPRDYQPTHPDDN